MLDSFLLPPTFVAPASYASAYGLRRTDQANGAAVDEAILTARWRYDPYCSQDAQVKHPIAGAPRYTTVKEMWVHWRDNHVREIDPPPSADLVEVFIGQLPIGIQCEFAASIVRLCCGVPVYKCRHGPLNAAKRLTGIVYVTVDRESVNHVLTFHHRILCTSEGILVLRQINAVTALGTRPLCIELPN
jgi:hypothetical protein